MIPPSTGESGLTGSIGGYALADRLGSGGMGVVHLGRSASGRYVAVKVVQNVDSVDSGCVSGGTFLYGAGTGFSVRPDRAP